MSRGLKNCNPGNIRISTTKWIGEIQPSTDKSFKQFKAMLARFIRAYKIVAKLSKIFKIELKLLLPSLSGTGS